MRNETLRLNETKRNEHGIIDEGKTLSQSWEYKQQINTIPFELICHKTQACLLYRIDMT